MDEEIEQLLVSVRADTQGFARDVSEMQGLLDGPFSAGLERVGATLERTLSRAIRTGSLGFEDLRNVALSVLSEIANAAIQNGLNSIIGGGGSGGGLLGFGTSILTSFLGAPGRAIGGPVADGRPFLVGESGPELFVPTSAGRIETLGRGSGGGAMNVTINISDNGRGSAPDQLRRSSRQLARSLRQALSARAD